jgi:hypothetical protein
VPADTPCKPMNALTNDTSIAVASAASWRIAGTSRVLTAGLVGFVAGVALSADPKRAAFVFGLGVAGFGGLLFLFYLSASDLTRLEPPELDRLPEDATRVPTLSLLVPNWHDGALVTSGVFAYFIGGPILLAFLSGFGPGLFLAGLPMYATHKWYERRNQCELFVDVNSGRPPRQLYVRALGR